MSQIGAKADYQQTLRFQPFDRSPVRDGRFGSEQLCSVIACQAAYPAFDERQGRLKTATNGNL
jgi:hypothetical protein